jgi:cell division protein FtsI/penicillin-binding protein 2
MDARPASGRPRAWLRPAIAIGTCANLLGAGALLSGCSSTASAGPTAHSFLAAWAKRDWATMRGLVNNPPADFSSVNAAALSDLNVSKASYQAGRLRTSGSTAAEPVTQRLSIDGIGSITIKTKLRLVLRSGKWLVAWSPATIAAPLKPGGRLSLTTTWPPRAPITGAGGLPLTTQARMVTIGVEGQRVKHAATLAAKLVASGATKQQAHSALAAAKAKPTWFEPVFTVTWARYQRLKPVLYPLPGTVFQTTRTRAAVTPGLAAHTVGSVGPVTAEELHSLGAPYTAQSLVGQSGLELANERQLAGRPGATAAVLSSSGKKTATLATIAPRPGKPVRTTIDPAVQRAAEAALAGDKKHAALVAVSAATGGVLASVSVPADSGFDQALGGSFPPGSSFKVITSTALIKHGLSPASPASCPPRITVDGAHFHNAEGTAPVSDLLHAFAESCNTAFIQLAIRHLSKTELPDTAALFGLGKTPRMGLPAFGGSVPTPTDQADLAATTIGQGKVLVSPLDMAMVAAAVDTGTVHSPRLVSGAPDDRAQTGTLPRAVVSGLHKMMAQVVATGTAAHRGLPPGTFAKTGTAEYGTGHPLPTDAWLIGFRGGIAFAMVTVNGGEGGPTDGPIVARFLDGLRGVHPGVSPTR